MVLHPNELLSRDFTLFLFSLDLQRCSHGGGFANESTNYLFNWMVIETSVIWNNSINDLPYLTIPSVKKKERKERKFWIPQEMGSDKITKEDEIAKIL